MSCPNFVKCTAGFRGGRRGRGGVGLSEKGEEQVCGKGLFLLFGVSQAGVRPPVVSGSHRLLCRCSARAPRERLVTCSLRNRGQA